MTEVTVLNDQELADTLTHLHDAVMKSLGGDLGKRAITSSSLCYILNTVMISVVGEATSMERSHDSIYAIVRMILESMPQAAANLSTALEISLEEEKKDKEKT